MSSLSEERFLTEESEFENYHGSMGMKLAATNLNQFAKGTLVRALKERKENWRKQEKEDGTGAALKSHSSSPFFFGMTGSQKEAQSAHVTAGSKRAFYNEFTYGLSSQGKAAEDSPSCCTTHEKKIKQEVQSEAAAEAPPEVGKEQATGSSGGGSPKRRLFQSRFTFDIDLVDSVRSGKK